MLRLIPSLVVSILVGCIGSSFLHAHRAVPHDLSARNAGSFDSFESAWPTPTDYRTASGAPGPGYWQQGADYRIKVELDDQEQQLRGEARIRYTNNSPHTLNYLWVQLDQNALKPGSASHRFRSFNNFEENDEGDDEPQSLQYRSYRTLKFRESFPGGYTLTQVTLENGTPLDYNVVETAMRVDLLEPLESGDSVTFVVGWENAITTDAFSFRYGVERMKKDNAPVYVIAQWYPRMCAYADASGWQLLPYLGAGEFALEFGDFEVDITVPEGFVVAASGELQNPKDVLTSKQQKRLKEAKREDEPVLIITPEEASKTRESYPTKGTSTWKFAASNVRDFAFATSPAYIWDAKGVEIDGSTRMAMSVYPQEAAPIWQRYSTEAVTATLEGYSRYVYPYPYPVAWSCYGPVGGMEYPMVSFQSGKAEEDGSYPLKRRNYVISVIVHEVGHNWFPMIINSDERKWMWMDEGLNSFYEQLVTTEFDPVIRESYRGDENWVLNNLGTSNDNIIMLQADSLTQTGYSAYTKPALGLMLLRESILGPDLFDQSMQEYARRWAFKRPIPADLFRTFEDVSGVNLDWFWRGWFYGDKALERGIKNVVSYRMDPSDLEAKMKMDRMDQDDWSRRPFDVYLENYDSPVDAHERLQDFYYHDDPLDPTEKEIKKHVEAIEKLEQWEKELLDDTNLIHIVEVESTGGLIMPMKLRLVFSNGDVADHDVPAQIWSRGGTVARIPFVDKRPLAYVELDPDNPFRDLDMTNNRFPPEIETKRFFLKSRKKDDNRMQDAMKDEEDEDEG